MSKSYAVSQDSISRKNAYSPLSSSWGLYNPNDLAKELNISSDKVHKALEKTGFNKAVRIREELIKWKERLRIEQRDLTKQRQKLQAELRQLNQRDQELREMLTNIRNILRLPREDGDGK